MRRWLGILQQPSQVSVPCNELRSRGPVLLMGVPFSPLLRATPHPPFPSGRYPFFFRAYRVNGTGNLNSCINGDDDDEPECSVVVVLAPGDPFRRRARPRGLLLLRAASSTTEWWALVGESNRFPLLFVLYIFEIEPAAAVCCNLMGVRFLALFFSGFCETVPP